MIERMPQIWLLKVRTSSRLHSTTSQPLRPLSRLNQSILSYHRSRRPYANYPPSNFSNPPQPNTQKVPHGINQAPMPQVQQNSPKNQAPFPTNFQPPSPRPPKRSRRSFIYAAVFLVVGATLGLYPGILYSSKLILEPHTQEDAFVKRCLHVIAAQKRIVKSLSQDQAWRAWDAYSIFTPEQKEHRLTSGPLEGSRGLGGYQRVFHNESTGEFVSVVFIGGAVTGWPAIVHGGLVATLLDENMGRCGISRLQAKTGVTANLDINYRKTVGAWKFYVIRCRPIEEGSTERKSYVSGTLETENGAVLAEAKGLFVQPKIIPTATLAQLESHSDVGF